MDNHNNYNEQIPNGDLEIENGNLEDENRDSDIENETPYVNHNPEPLTPQKNSENQLIDVEDWDVYKVLQESFIRASITKYDGKNEKNETARVLFNKLLLVDIQQDDLIKTLKRGLYYLSAYSKDDELVGQITDILIRNSNE